jgi:hypothetical protein
MNFLISLVNLVVLPLLSTPDVTGVFARNNSLSDSAPSVLIDKNEAKQYKCKEVNLKKQLGNCVIRQNSHRKITLIIYDKLSNGTFKRENQLILDSWYLGAEIEYVDILNNGKKFILVRNLEGATGTGTSQKLLALWGWDGNQFKITLLEIQKFYDARRSSRIQKLDTNINFALQNNKPIVLLKYKYYLYLRYVDDVMEQNWEWQNELQWNPNNFSFYSTNSEELRKSSSKYPVEKYIAEARLNLLLNPIQNLTMMDIEKTGIYTFQGWYK